ncbi:hypothetical protein FB567DRAFT_627981 [Paraphoma chrysanthemicola]|uniref:Uncharacterized protein n=1 Tax=Paraphoma chrysanthemicola TaxID=798071 RepID=A0A8K0R5M8_9PLEO|nr:hypothetical protein FB567DRAFT_627981 [Paraphoma chrysanthemicola]
MSAFHVFACGTPSVVAAGAMSSAIQDSLVLLQILFIEVFQSDEDTPPSFPEKEALSDAAHLYFLSQFAKTTKLPDVPNTTRATLIGWFVDASVSSMIATKTSRVDSVPTRTIEESAAPTPAPQVPYMKTEEDDHDDMEALPSFPTPSRIGMGSRTVGDPMKSTYGTIRKPVIDLCSDSDADERRSIAGPRASSANSQQSLFVPDSMDERPFYGVSKEQSASKRQRVLEQSNLMTNATAFARFNNSRYRSTATASSASRAPVLSAPVPPFKQTEGVDISACGEHILGLIWSRGHAISPYVAQHINTAKTLTFRPMMGSPTGRKGSDGVYKRYADKHPSKYMDGQVMWSELAAGAGRGIFNFDTSNRVFFAERFPQYLNICGLSFKGQGLLNGFMRMVAKAPLKHEIMMHPIDIEAFARLCGFYPQIQQFLDICSKSAPITNIVNVCLECGDTFRGINTHKYSSHLKKHHAAPRGETKHDRCHFYPCNVIWSYQWQSDQHIKICEHRQAWFDAFGPDLEDAESDDTDSVFGSNADGEDDDEM